MIPCEMTDYCLSSDSMMRGKVATNSRNHLLTDSSVLNKMDFYEGYPHFFWTWPSPKLDGPRDEYNFNVGKGVEFVIS